MRYRHYLPLLAILVLATFVGVFDAGESYSGMSGNTPTTIASLLGVMLVFIWYRLDAQQRHYKPSWGLNVGMLLLTAVAVPWYLIRSRVGTEIIGGLAGMLGLFLLTMCCYRLGASI